MGIRIGVVAGRPDLLLAKLAIPACDREWHDHSIAPLKVRYAFSGFLDNSHELVPENVAFFHGRDEPIEQMKIRSANGSAGDFDDGVVRIQDRRIADVVNLNLATSHPTERFHN